MLRGGTETAETGKRLWVRTVATLFLTLFSLTTVSAAASGLGERDIDVATVNLYVGADFTPIIALDPNDPNYGLKLLTAVSTVYGHVVASNFPARADALARQIVERSPELVALQEVTLLRRQSPGDAIVGGGQPATTVELDYLEVLLAALRRHGGHYAVAAKVQDTDVEVPIAVSGASGVTFDDIRLTDRDVILVRTDLPPGHLRLSNPQSANFQAALPLPTSVKVLRGWCSVDVQTRGRAFRFVSTHLEDQLPPTLPNLQGLQAAELVARTVSPTLPVILAGDFNSDANGAYSSSTYGFLTQFAGFTDTWNSTHKNIGLTWGHDELLSDPSVPFIYRLDLILFLGKGFRAVDAEIIDPRIGPTPPLWFSDHAAVFATLEID